MRLAASGGGRAPGARPGDCESGAGARGPAGAGLSHNGKVASSSNVSLREPRKRTRATSRSLEGLGGGRELGGLAARVRSSAPCVFFFFFSRVASVMRSGSEDLPCPVLLFSTNPPVSETVLSGLEAGRPGKAEALGLSCPPSPETRLRGSRWTRRPCRPHGVGLPHCSRLPEAKVPLPAAACASGGRRAARVPFAMGSRCDDL